MKIETPRELFELCKDQDARIHRLVRESMEAGRSRQGQSYEPTAILAGLGEAGRYLRALPHRGLLSGSLICRDLVECDTAMATLIDVLNASVVRIEPDEDSVSFEHGRRRREVKACAFADRGFYHTARSLEKFINGEEPQYGSHIIMDGEEPVLLRKSFGIHSSLALKPLNINGVVYPAGSIVQTARFHTKAKKDIDSAPQTKIGLVPIDEVETVLFGRLSPFAFDPSERDSAYYLHNSVEPHEVDGIRNLTIGQIAELATKAAVIAQNREDEFITGQK